MHYAFFLLLYSCRGLLGIGMQSLCYCRAMLTADIVALPEKPMVMQSS